jgi:hypothetical protein
MFPTKKTQTVTELRNILYNQIDMVNNGDYDHKKANSITQAAAGIFQSYKLQLQAMAVSGKKKEVEKLSGLLD